MAMPQGVFALALTNQTPHSYPSPSSLSPPTETTGCSSSSNPHCPAPDQSTAY